jgi:hypothetical protein
MSKHVRILVAVLALVLAHTTIGVCQWGDGKDAYETGVAALSRGYLDMALRCFQMVMEYSPDSSYAPAACTTAIVVYLGQAKACDLVAEALRRGSGNAPGEQGQQFLDAAGALVAEKQELVAGLATSYDLLRRRFADTAVTLRLGFPDIARNIEPVREDLADLENGKWIPLLLLGGLEDQVRMLSVYADLLVITGVDLVDHPLEEWLGLGSQVERLVVKEAFYYQVGSLFAREGQREQAIDALQLVIQATEYESHSTLRAAAAALLADMGASDASPSQEDELVALPPASPPAQPGDVTSVLFDQTRLITRPTGESDCEISGTDWFGCSDLQALLRSNGCATASLETELIILPDLVGYDVFAILATDHNRPYSMVEIWAILLYVEQGGGLLLCESTWQGSQTREFTVGAIAGFFGVDFAGNGMIREAATGEEGPGVVEIPDLVSHPVTDGVTRFTVVEAGFLSETGPAQILARSSVESWFDDSTVTPLGLQEAGEPAGPLPVLAVLEYGEGRIAFLGDGMLFTNYWLSETGNRTLALNLFKWLSGGS